ncbi:toll/interleukin-1 receptor domain-containing protein [Streptacidiphilus sp. N1-3]|uniref:Toll/interleukin-1 receptor domain-containing protein n=1 Tax=Streptacidiphilus alkalitolerans TaxID=3342712 RepID=A0ABV6WYF6_9ACTN
MPEVFINYRTGDEEGSATLIERELSSRFGSDRIFRASKSIAPGSSFPQELIIAARRCRVLLAVIGPRWAEVRTADGRRMVDDPEDWTRREILEALGSGAQVVPVLVGRAMRLDGAGLPPELVGLVDYQYRRLDHRNAEADLVRLGDTVAELIPELALADAARRQKQEQTAAPEAERGATSRDTRIANRASRHRQRGGIGNLVGDFSGTFVSESQGPVHTGKGNQYNGTDYYTGIADRGGQGKDGHQ